jgi:hypothetical protein
MSVAQLNGLEENWDLLNTLTIFNNVEVKGDINTTGFIYDGNIPIEVTGDDNVWTGNNTFTNFQPTFIDPVADEDMANVEYMSTAFTDLGASYLPTNNNWTGQNTMTELPVITNNATAGTNEAVNKSVVDTFINTSTGNLDTANVWTGTSVFTNTFTVPTPLTDNAFGNKKYVDDELNLFNTGGGTTEYQEITSQTIGTTNVTLDPAVYTCMYACLVSKGGNGAPVGTVTTGQTIKSFGGSGAFSVAKIPAYAGNGVYTILATGCAFSIPNGTIINLSNGQDGSAVASGAGGVVQPADPSVVGNQAITGSTEPLQNPIGDDTINASYNIGCLNGYGQGGSFRWDTGVTIDPTGYYALFIKFKK